MPEQLPLAERSPEQQAALEARILARQQAIARARAAGNYVLRMCCGPYTCFFAIPKKHADTPIPPVAGLDAPHGQFTAQMLDGATYYPRGNPRHDPKKTVVATPPLMEETES